jgi:hypothetical protein
MKKYLSMICVLGLAACATTEFVAFEGTKVVVGEGGFPEKSVDGVKFYTSGLPQGQKCTVLGQVKDEHQPDIWGKRDPIYKAVAKQVVAFGGNVASDLKQEKIPTGGTTYGGGDKGVGIGWTTSDVEETNTYTAYSCK